MRCRGGFRGYPAPAMDGETPGCIPRITGGIPPLQPLYLSIYVYIYIYIYEHSYGITYAKA